MKKIISMLLVLLMLAIPLASCGDPADDGTDTKDPAQSGDDTVDSGTVEQKDILEIPDEDFGEEEFVILTHNIVNWNYGIMDFEEPSDDAYENALYERNLAVEELLNVQISQVLSAQGNDVYSLFKTAVDANTGDYGVTCNNINYCCTATGAGYCYSLDNFEYVDLEKSWWNRDCTEQLALGGEHYMVSGDIMLGDKECLWAMYFIKELIEDNNLENPYELVTNNKWTWDKMMEMATTATNDLNGSGALDSGDIYGFCTHAENYAASWQAADMKLITLDDDGVPQVSWNNEQFVNVFEDIVEVMGNTEVVSNNNIDIITSNLMEGKTLFGTEVIAFVRTYRENEHEFGILPYPKYSSEIERYNSYMAINGDVLTVGNDCHDTYKTSIILEAMAAKGSEILIPAYYEGQLKSRYANDEESSAMLDIIFEYRSYDLGVFFNWGSAYSSLSTATANPATLYESVKKPINKQIEKSLEKLGIY